MRRPVLLIHREGIASYITVINRGDIRLTIPMAVIPIENVFIPVPLNRDLPDPHHLIGSPLELIADGENLNR